MKKSQIIYSMGGTSGVGTPRSWDGWRDTWGAAVVGGAAGKAINVNGNAINWITGSGSNNVKGPVN